MIDALNPLTLNSQTRYSTDASEDVNPRSDPVRDIHTQYTQSIDLLPPLFPIPPLDPYLEDALLFR